MANPFQASLIICPPIGSGFDNPVAWKVGLWVPVGEMVGTLDDQERREAPPFGINTFDCRSPFPIARLDGLTSAVSIGASNYHWGAANDAHHEAGLIEVVEVAILYSRTSPSCCQPAWTTRQWVLDLRRQLFGNRIRDLNAFWAPVVVQWTLPSRASRHVRHRAFREEDWPYLQHQRSGAGILADPSPICIQQSRLLRISVSFCQPLRESFFEVRPLHSVTQGSFGYFVDLRSLPTT